jgi:acetylornithine deacetylase/succinyl-diaminopimelate desuccinylase-like protein
MAAIWIATLIRLKQEHFVPDRDIIVALTSDEETGDYNGVAWLLQNHRDLIDASIALNEGGGGAMKSGKYLYNGVGASEKVYITLRLEVKNPGGHSSLPREPNAIYQLADALGRVHAYQFPVKLNEITRAYFAKMAAFEEGSVSDDMRALAERDDPAAAARLSRNYVYNARMRTTCVATRLEGGHADNALPQTARATINCRVLPGDDPEQVRGQLVNAIHDPAVEVTWIDRAKLSVPSPLTPAAMKPIEEVTHAFWPGVVVVPLMSTGASDGLYLRNAGIPTYGVSGLFGEIGESRSHGRDERVGVQQFYDSAQFLYALVKRFSNNSKS